MEKVFDPKYSEESQMSLYFCVFDQEVVVSERAATNLYKENKNHLWVSTFYTYNI